MGKACSLDLRERICAYIGRGHSARAAGRVFGVSAATAVRFAANRIESDHAALKRQLGYRQSFRSLRTAKSTLRNIEAIRTIKNGHINNVKSGVQGEIDLSTKSSVWLLENRANALVRGFAPLTHQSLLTHTYIYI